MFTLYQNIDMNVAEDPWLTKAPLKNGGGWCYESSMYGYKCVFADRRKTIRMHQNSVDDVSSLSRMQNVFKKLHLQ